MNYSVLLCLAFILKDFAKTRDQFPCVKNGLIRSVSSTHPLFSGRSNVPKTWALNRYSTVYTICVLLLCRWPSGFVVRASASIGLESQKFSVDSISLSHH